MQSIADLPYRPCVGILLLNPVGRVWIGRRIPKSHDDKDRVLWQMPQGGIDKGEQPADAAVRELREETGVSSVQIIAETQNWLRYDLPENLIGRALKGRYRGQTQKWYAMRFHGADSEIDIGEKPGQEAEFDDWRWSDINEVADLIVAFKRDVYRQVITEFAPLAIPNDE